MTKTNSYPGEPQEGRFGEALPLVPEVSCGFPGQSWDKGCWGRKFLLMHSGELLPAPSAALCFVDIIGFLKLVDPWRVEIAEGFGNSAKAHMRGTTQL